MSKDDNWAGKGFGKRNEESAPEPKPEPDKFTDDPLDPDRWVWE